MIGYKKGKLSTKRKYTPIAKSIQKKYQLKTTAGERHSKLKEEQPKFFGDTQMVKVSNLVIGFTKSKAKLDPNSESKPYNDGKSSTVSEFQRVVVTPFYKNKEQDFVSYDTESSMLTSKKILPGSRQNEGVDRPRLILASAKSHTTEPTDNTTRIKFHQPQSFRVRNEYNHSEKSELAVSIGGHNLGQMSATNVGDFFQPVAAHVSNGFSMRANENFHHMTYRTKANRSTVSFRGDTSTRVMEAVSMSTNKPAFFSGSRNINSASFRIGSEDKKLFGLRPMTSRIDLTPSTYGRADKKQNKVSHTTGTTIATEASQDHARNVRYLASQQTRRASVSNMRH